MTSDRQEDQLAVLTGLQGADDARHRGKGARRRGTGAGLQDLAKAVIAKDGCSPGAEGGRRTWSQAAPTPLAGELGPQLTGRDAGREAEARHTCNKNGVRSTRYRGQTRHRVGSPGDARLREASYGHRRHGRGRARGLANGLDKWRWKGRQCRVASCARARSTADAVRSRDRRQQVKKGLGRWRRDPGGRPVRSCGARFRLRAVSTRSHSGQEDGKPNVRSRQAGAAIGMPAASATSILRKSRAELGHPAAAENTRRRGQRR